MDLVPRPVALSQVQIPVQDTHLHPPYPRARWSPFLVRAKSFFYCLTSEPRLQANIFKAFSWVPSTSGSQNDEKLIVNVTAEHPFVPDSDDDIEVPNRIVQVNVPLNPARRVAVPNPTIRHVVENHNSPSLSCHQSPSAIKAQGQQPL